MRDRFIDPEVKGSFRRGAGKFISRNAGGFISCPPYVIASAASYRLTPEAQLELPEGYHEAVLDHIRTLTGWPGRDVAVSFRQAAELAMIGFQLQELDAEGKVEPPLSSYQQQSVSYLLGEICALNFDGMANSKLNEADLAYIAMAQATLTGSE